MSSHDTLPVEASQDCAKRALTIKETSEFLLQACGLCEGVRSDPWGQAEQSELTPQRGRGRPQQIGWTHLWSSLPCVPCKE